VGPLNPKTTKSWVERTDEKIYPWNFSKVVDEEKSAQAFMDKRIGRCTYTKEPVLPMNSLLYSEYKVLNELNPMMINGKPIPADVKNKVFEDLFVNSGRKVTKNSIRKYLLANGYITDTDELSGIDDTVKSNLKSWHDFKDILDRTHDYDQVERIIRSMVVFNADKKMLRKWLDKNTHGLTEDDKRKIGRLNYKDWGSLSKEFLTDIYSPNESGEVMNIIEKLRSSNLNLMKLLSGEFAKKVIEVAGPICALGFIVCLIGVIVSRRKEERVRI
jgi:CRISPR-associated endonuclease Csn1